MVLTQNRVTFSESVTQLWYKPMFSLAVSVNIVIKHVDLLGLPGKMKSELKKLKSRQVIFAMRKKAQLS